MKFLIAFALLLVAMVCATPLSVKQQSLGKRIVEKVPSPVDSIDGGRVVSRKVRQFGGFGGFGGGGYDDTNFGGYNQGGSFGGLGGFGSYDNSGFDYSNQQGGFGGGFGGFGF